MARRSLSGRRGDRIELVCLHCHQYVLVLVKGRLKERLKLTWLVGDGDLKV